MPRLVPVHACSEGRHQQQVAAAGASGGGGEEATAEGPPGEGSACAHCEASHRCRGLNTMGGLRCRTQVCWAAIKQVVTPYSRCPGLEICAQARHPPPGNPLACTSHTEGTRDSRPLQPMRSARATTREGRHCASSKLAWPAPSPASCRLPQMARACAPGATSARLSPLPWSSQAEGAPGECEFVAVAGRPW